MWVSLPFKPFTTVEARATTPRLQRELETDEQKNNESNKLFCLKYLKYHKKWRYYVQKSEMGDETMYTSYVCIGWDRPC